MTSHHRRTPRSGPRCVTRAAAALHVGLALGLGLALAACGKESEPVRDIGARPPAAPAPAASAQETARITAPAEPVNPDDRRAMARLAQGYDIEMTEEPEPISVTRGTRSRGDFAALLLWPRRDVRLEGLTSYAIEAGQEYGEDGDLAFLEFRRGGKTLWRSRAPFDPKTFVETGLIPDEVTQELKVDDKVTWGLFYDKKSRKPDVQTEFAIVRSPAAEKKVDRLRTDPRFRREEPLTRELLVAQALETHRLYTESLVLNIRLAQENPTRLAPLQGIVVALQRLKLEDSRLWAAVSGSASGHGRADAAMTASARTTESAGTASGTGAGGASPGSGGPEKGAPTVAAVTRSGGGRLGLDQAKELARHLPPAHGLAPGGAVPSDLATAPSGTGPAPFRPSGTVPPGLRTPGATPAPTPGQGPAPTPGSSGGVPVPGEGANAAALERAATDAARTLRLADEEAGVRTQAAAAAEGALSAATDSFRAAEDAERAAQRAIDEFVASGDETADRAATRRNELALEVAHRERARLGEELTSLARQAAEARHLAQEALRRAAEASLAAELARHRLADLGAAPGTTSPQEAARLRGRADQIAELRRAVLALETSAATARTTATEAHRLYEEARDAAAASHDPDDARKAQEALTKSLEATMRLRAEEQRLFDASVRLRELAGGPPGR